MHSTVRPTGSAGGENVETAGKVLNWGWRYDLMGWVFDLLTGGKLSERRRTTVARARLRPGEAVLDVGCGTGTLALALREQVGPAGRVVGIDAGVQQIARARSQARKRGIDVDFRVAAIERLPFEDGSFDAVLSTIMLHHLPDDLKKRGLAEVARVLRAGGRVAIADFKSGHGGGIHGERPGSHAGEQDLPALLAQTGFTRIETEEMLLPWVPAHPRLLEIVSGVKA